MHNNTMIRCEFSILLSARDRSSRQIISKGTLISTLYYTEWTQQSYREHFIQQQQNTVFSSRTFSRINHMIGHKTSLCKFKKTEIIPSVFFNHNSMKAEINKGELDNQ